MAFGDRRSQPVGSPRSKPAGVEGVERRAVGHTASAWQTGTWGPETPPCAPVAPGEGTAAESRPPLLSPDRTFQSGSGTNSCRRFPHLGARLPRKSQTRRARPRLRQVTARHTVPPVRSPQHTRWEERCGATLPSAPAFGAAVTSSRRPGGMQTSDTHFLQVRGWESETGCMQSCLGRAPSPGSRAASPSSCAVLAKGEGAPASPFGGC